MSSVFLSTRGSQTNLILKLFLARVEAFSGADVRFSRLVLFAELSKCSRSVRSVNLTLYRSRDGWLYFRSVDNNRLSNATMVFRYLLRRGLLLIPWVLTSRAGDRLRLFRRVSNL